jgi:uncharacterized RDD family membrane protein YckC
VRRRQGVLAGEPAEPAEGSAAPGQVVPPIPPIPPVRPIEGFVPSGVDAVTGRRLASWGRRAGAYFLDVLLVIVSLVPTVIWVATTEDPATGEPTDLALVLLGFQFFIGPSLYQWLMLGARGATLGKLAVGIAVVRGEDAGKLGFGRAAGRVASVFVLWTLCYFPGLLSFLWPLWDTRNQALHDKMVNSIVVRG